MNHAEQDFWTRRILLEEISRSEYYLLRRSWGCRTIEKEIHDTYAQIINPPVAESYESLISTFLGHPAAKKLSVFKPGKGWRKYAVNEINPDLSRTIVTMAENDALGYDNFEMSFQPVQANAGGIEERAKIVFCEAGDLLVGYKIKVHRDNLPLFDSTIRNPKQLIISAIADPRDYRTD